MSATMDMEVGQEVWITMATMLGPTTYQRAALVEVLGDEGFLVNLGGRVFFREKAWPVSDRAKQLMDELERRKPTDG